MQKIMKMCALIMSVSLCAPQQVCAKSKSTTESTIKATISAAITAGCGYAVLKYLPKVIGSGQRWYGVLVLRKSISKNGFSKLIQESLIYGIGVAFMVGGVIKFGSLTLDNVGKILR